MTCVKQSAGAPKEDSKMKKGKKGKDGKTGSKQHQQQQSKKRPQGKLTINDITSETPATMACTTGLIALHLITATHFTTLNLHIFSLTLH